MMPKHVHALGSVVLLLLVLLAGLLPSASFGPSTVMAQTTACNLAPNGAFERGGSASFDTWGLATTPHATLSVSTNPVQSGARALRLTVTQPGGIYVTTVPENKSIPVLPNTTYVFSIRLYSANGQQAGINAVETDINGLLVTQRWLAIGGGSGQWVTLEGSFTTASNTRYVALRLIHHISAGTFIWDDARFWQTTAGQRCMDARHYITQSMPGFKMCSAPNYPASGICIDGWRDQYNEYIIGYTHGIRDYWTHNDASANRIGIHKNSDTQAGWRCFANAGLPCGPSSGANATYPPQTIDLSRMLPVINSFDPNSNRVTLGAALIHDWQRFDVRGLNPTNGAQTGPLGPIFHREYAFIAASVNFGGDLGVQQNVLVYETESTGTQPTGFNGGERMERYFYVMGYGRVREQGHEDTVCRANRTAANCDGIYDAMFPATPAIFPYRNSGDFNPNSIAPYTIVSWW